MRGQGFFDVSNLTNFLSNVRPSHAVMYDPEPGVSRTRPELSGDSILALGQLRVRRTLLRPIPDARRPSVQDMQCVAEGIVLGNLPPMNTRDPFAGTALHSRKLCDGGLAEWPLGALLVTAFGSWLTLGVAAVGARATRRGWPWVPLGVASAAVALHRRARGVLAHLCQPETEFGRI